MRSIERLAPGRFEQQYSLTTLVHQIQRPQRPRSVEMVLQSIFVSEPVDAAWARLLAGASYRDELPPAAIGAFAPGSAKDTLSVVPQHLESAVLAAAGPRGWNSCLEFRRQARLDWHMFCRKD